MSTPEAIQNLIEHIKSMSAEFFTMDHAVGLTSATCFNNDRLTIRNRGFSSATTQHSLHFVAHLGSYQPPDSIRGYNVWVNDPKTEDPGANQAAVVAALESLVKKGTWSSSTMVSVTA